jgi:hypothetical protein
MTGVKIVVVGIRYTRQVRIREAVNSTIAVVQRYDDKASALNKTFNARFVMLLALDRVNAVENDHSITRIETIRPNQLPVALLCHCD